jgi:hypothetical protein
MPRTRWKRLADESEARAVLLGEFPLGTRPDRSGRRSPRSAQARQNTARETAHLGDTND